MIGLQGEEISKEKAKATVLIAKTVADAIKEAGEIPSGHLYSILMGVMDLGQYQALIDIFKEAGVVNETPNHLLQWIKK